MNNRVIRFQLYAGSELANSKMSFHESRTVAIEATAIGIKMISTKSKRVVVIPYGNVKAFELCHEASAPIPAPTEDDAAAEAQLDAAVEAAVPKRRGRPPVAK